MEDAIHALLGFSNKLAAVDGAFDEGAVEAVQVSEVTGAEVVEHADIARLAQLVIDDEGADKT